jgi:micrococcal nuclease
MIIFLILILFTINYSFLNSALINLLEDREIVYVERVIDGDTIVVENKTSIRLLGINAPEKGEKYYNEAKEFLKKSSSNKTIELEFGEDKYDRYKRILAYIFIKGENINLELVKNGFANFYFPSGKDIYYDEFKKAWEECVLTNKNLCEKSYDNCAMCIELKEFDYRNDKIVFYNRCSFNCDLTGWRIKDEGRKNFIFDKFTLESNSNVEIKVEDNKNTKTTLFWKGEKSIWTDSGDTLFLRDKDNKLVLWESY